MNILNRRELYLTLSMAEQARITSILAQHGIPYQVLCRHRGSSFMPDGWGSRGHRGAYGQDMESFYQYRVYVHKNDLERARRLTGLGDGSGR